VYRMRTGSFYLFLWTVFAGALSAQEQGRESIIQQIGHYDSLHSKILGEKRTLLISLPDDYETSSKEYPVLYILDGENTYLFGQAVSAVTFYSGVRRLPKMIIIGILNIDRTRDITPVKIKQRENSGGGDKFLEFIVTELSPYIETKYQAAKFRILFGGSSAGMFALYTLFDRPELFNAYIASRPALNSTANYTWDSEVIFRKADSLFAEKSTLPYNIYIDYGGQEDALHDPVPIHKLADIFKEKAPQDFRWKVCKTGESGYRSAESLKNGLLSIFDDWYYPADSLYLHGFAGIENHTNRLSSRYGFPVSAGSILAERDFITFGWRFYEHEQLDESISLLSYCMKIYPDSWTAYECLGDAFFRKGQKKSARKNFKKSLQLNPDNKYVREMLLKLKREN